MKKAVLRAFRDIAAEPDEEKRREACMDYIEHVWEAALIGRSYMNKNGDEITVPDLGIQRDIALALPELMGVSPPKAALGSGRLGGLSVFNGEKQRKAG